MNFGLRYEWTSWYSSRNNPPNASWFDAIGNQFVFAGPNPITGEPANTTPTFIVPDKNNWAPRIGFAYLLGQRDHDPRRVLDLLWLEHRLGGEPHAGQLPLRPGPELRLGEPGQFHEVSTDDPFPALDPSRPSAQHTAQGETTSMPYIQQWNFGVQRQLAEDLMWEVNYVGSKGTRAEPRSLTGTTPCPGPSAADGETIQQRRPHPIHTGAFSENQSDAVSSYHGLTTKLEKRFSRGLSYRMNYAWSKSMDLNSQWGGTSAQNSLDKRGSIGALRLSQGAYLQRGHGLAAAAAAEPHGRAWTRSSTTGRSTPSSSCGAGRFLTPTLIGDHNNVAGRGTQPETGSGGVRLSAIRGLRIDGLIRRSFALPNLPQFVGDDSGYGTAGRNIIEGPGHAGVDFSFYKNIPITERLVAQLRFEFFNIFNRVNFNNPGVGGWDSVELPELGQDHRNRGREADPDRREVLLLIRGHPA